MKEPVVTIKLTESELKLVSESLDLCIHELPQHEDNEDDDEKTPARLTSPAQRRAIIRQHNKNVDKKRAQYKKFYRHLMDFFSSLS